MEVNNIATSYDFMKLVQKWFPDSYSNINKCEVAEIEVTTKGITLFGDGYKECFRPYYVESFIKDALLILGCKNKSICLEGVFKLSIISEAGSPLILTFSEYIIKEKNHE